MYFKQILISLGLLLILAHESSGQAVQEGLPGGVIFGRLQLVNVQPTTTVSHPHNHYIQAQRYASLAYELITTDTFQDFVTEERSVNILRQANLYCDDEAGSVVRVQFVIPVPDTSDQEPIIEIQEILLPPVEIPWDDDGTTETDIPITVSDADYELENADIQVTSNNSFFEVVATPRWTEPCPEKYIYDLSLIINNTVSDGNHNLLIIASDGVHEVSVNYLVRISKDEPEDEECGILGLDNSEPITLPQPLDPDVPTGSEVWRGTLFNVNSTSSVNHPHNVYLQAFRQVDTYFFTTTDSFPNFEGEQETNVILRTVDTVRCGGSAGFHELRVQANEGAEVDMNTGVAYSVEGDFSPVSTSSHLRVVLSTTVDVETVSIMDENLPNSGYTAGQRTTGRFEVTLPEELAGHSGPIQLQYYNHNNILEICVTFQANMH